MRFGYNLVITLICVLIYCFRTGLITSLIYHVGSRLFTYSFPTQKVFIDNLSYEVLFLAALQGIQIYIKHIYSLKSYRIRQVLVSCRNTKRVINDLKEALGCFKGNSHYDGESGKVSERRRCLRQAWINEEGWYRYRSKEE